MSDSLGAAKASGYMQPELEPTREQMEAQIGDLKRRGAIDRDLIDQLEAAGLVDRTKVEQMAVALVTSRRIGAAMGILMAMQKITEEQAFDLLREASQNSRRKLRDVAADVVLTGAIDNSATAD